MSKWYVKDLSQLTGVSVQTLHHYDRIDLLKPSLRLANGYRVYNQNDLLKLQQIVALKFFGFELRHIKKVLGSEKAACEHFRTQIDSLEAKAKTLLEASAVLRQVVEQETDAGSIPWQSIIKLIEVYRMSDQLEHQWVKEIYTPEELEQYLAFEKEWKQKSTPEQKNAFEQSWAKLVDKISNNLSLDPHSAFGIEVGKQCMQLINEVYGKKYAHLRTKKFEQGFAKGKGLKEVGLTVESVEWMDKAIDAYWRQRIFEIMSKVGTGIADDEIFHLWNEVLEEMCGDDDKHKKSIYEAALNDNNISHKAKLWLRTLKDLVDKNNHLK